MIPETAVVGVAGPRRGRERVHHHEDSTARDSTTSEKPNDTKAVEVAYTKVRNVPAHSCVATGVPALSEIRIDLVSKGMALLSAD